MQTFYSTYHFLWRMVECRKMKTERLNKEEILPTVRLKTYSAHGSYMQCKCKRKRKWKCKRVHTSNANAKKERYGSAVEVFFQDGRQRLSFCRFTRVGSKRKCKLKKMKSCSLPAFKLAFAFALALGWFTRAILCICICVCVC